MIPPDAELTARPAEIPAWDDMPDDLKPVLRPPDGGLRRLPGAHRPPRRPAGGRAGRPRRSWTTRWSTSSSATTARRPRARSTAPSTRWSVLQRRGGAGDARVHGRAGSTSSARPKAYNHYAVGWAHAMDTPYQWTKQVASHWGGTRNGTIVHWPGGHRRQGRDPQPVPPRHRRRPDRARGGRPAGADDRQRRRSSAAARA